MSAQRKFPSLHFYLPMFLFFPGDRHFLQKLFPHKYHQLQFSPRSLDTRTNCPFVFSVPAAVNNHHLHLAIGNSCPQIIDCGWVPNHCHRCIQKKPPRVLSSHCHGISFTEILIFFQGAKYQCSIWAKATLPLRKSHLTSKSSCKGSASHEASS